MFKLYPDNVFINEAYPRHLFFQGKLIEAKRVLEQVLKRDIERSDIYVMYGELIWLLEGKDKAIDWFSQSVHIKTDQTHYLVIQALLGKDIKLSQVNNRINIVEQQLSDGDTWPINFVEASLIALWLAEDPEQAIVLLQKAIFLGYLDSEYLAISPFFAKLREHPQFVALLDDIKMQRAQMNKIFLASYEKP